MIDLKHLINYLPYYYKEADSYKDNDGKGILEKFLEICGNYFLKRIKEPVDNTLVKLLKVHEDTDYYYLNLIWHWFGEFPFINITQPSPLNLYGDQKTDILRYIISLYKIRGTEKFFQIIFKLWYNEENDIKLVSIKQISPDWLKDFRDSTIPRTNITSKIIWPYYDMSTFDGDINLDEQQILSFNGIVEFNVTINENLGDMKKIWKFIKNFIDRFLPFNVISKLLLNGKNYDETTYHFNVYTFNGSKWVRRDRGTTLSLDPDEDLRVKIELLDNYNRKVKDIPWYGDLIYTVGKNPSNDPNYTKGISEKSRYYGERYLNISSVYRPSDVGEVKKVSNTYRFYLDDPNKAFTLIVSNDKYQNISYYVIKLGEYDKVYDGENTIRIPVEAYRVDGNSKLPVHIVSEHSGDVKESNSGNQFITTWDINQGGNYKFHIEEDPSKIVEAIITNRKPGYKVLLGYKYVKRTYNKANSKGYETTIDKLGDKSSRVVLDTQMDLLKNAEIKVYIESLNHQPVPGNLTVTIKGTNIHLKNGDIWKPLSMDTYTFNVEQGNQDLNQPAVLEIVDKAIQLHFMRITSVSPKDYIDNSTTQTGLLLTYVPFGTYSEDFINKQDNSSYIVTAPEGKTYNIGTRDKETPKVDKPEFVIDRVLDNVYPNKYSLRITSKQAGLFYIQSPFNRDESFEWYVLDKRTDKSHISYLEITPIYTDKSKDHWINKNTSDNTFGITFAGNSPFTDQFILRLVDGNGNTVQDSDEEVIMETIRRDGRTITEKVDLSKVLTVEGNTTFKAYLKDGRTLIAKLNWLQVTVLPSTISWVTNEFGLVDKAEKSLLIDTMGNNNLAWSLTRLS
nr:MAG TPA: hypothetical protein [Caudoviricetes sp.]